MRPPLESWWNANHPGILKFKLWICYIYQISRNNRNGSFLLCTPFVHHWHVTMWCRFGHSFILINEIALIFTWNNDFTTSEVISALFVFFQNEAVILLTFKVVIAPVERNNDGRTYNGYRWRIVHGIFTVYVNDVPVICDTRIPYAEHFVGSSYIS